MTDRRAWEEELDRAIRRLAPRAERLSDALAARPEVSGEERYASSRHRRFLRSRGFLVRPGAAGLPWAYEARAEGPPGGSVAFAAEMDALPDLGHACGHNLGGALSLLAGAALAELLPRIGGSVTVWGTPEEERGGGKARMAEAGLFDGHHLLASVHPSASESFLRPRTLACAAFLGTFRGDRGGRLFLHATDLLRRTLPPEVRLQVRPRGPDAEGVVWAPRRELLRLALDRLRRALEGCAAALGEEGAFSLPQPALEDLVPSPAGEALTERVFRDLGIPARGEPTELGTTDLGNASRRCPVVQPFLALLDRPCGWHEPAFAAQVTSPGAHRGLRQGARILARMGLAVLLDRELRTELRRDYPAI